MLDKYLDQIYRGIHAETTGIEILHDCIEAEFDDCAPCPLSWYFDPIREQVIKDLSAKDAQRVTAYIDQAKQYETEMETTVADLKKFLQALENLQKKFDDLYQKIGNEKELKNFYKHPKNA